MITQLNVTLYTCEVLEETVRGLEGRLVLEETEKLAAYEREMQLVSKVTKYNYICISYISIMIGIGPCKI